MGRDRRHRHGDRRPKTVRRWLTCTLIANGIDHQGLHYDDAVDACRILLATGRTVRPADWAAMGGDDSDVLESLGPL